MGDPRGVGVVAFDFIVIGAHCLEGDHADTWGQWVGKLIQGVRAGVVVAQFAGNLSPEGVLLLLNSDFVINLVV